MFIIKYLSLRKWRNTDTDTHTPTEQDHVNRMPNKISFKHVANGSILLNNKQFEIEFISTLQLFEMDLTALCRSGVSAMVIA